MWVAPGRRPKPGRRGAQGVSRSRSAASPSPARTPRAQQPHYSPAPSFPLAPPSPRPPLRPPLAPPATAAVPGPRWPRAQARAASHLLGREAAGAGGGRREAGAREAGARASGSAAARPSPAPPHPRPSPPLSRAPPAERRPAGTSPAPRLLGREAAWAPAKGEAPLRPGAGAPRGLAGRPGGTAVGVRRVPTPALSRPPRSASPLPVPPPLPPPEGSHSRRAGRCRPRGGRGPAGREGGRGCGRRRGPRAGAADPTPAGRPARRGAEEAAAASAGACGPERVAGRGQVRRPGTAPPGSSGPSRPAGLPSRCGRPARLKHPGEMCTLGSPSAITRQNHPKAR